MKSPSDDPSPSEEMGSMAPLLAAVARTGPTALAAGTMVGGQYRIERSLGEGGMGVVYRARDTRLGRDVAVKVGSAVSQLALKRIEREAMALAKLSHPNVVVVHQVGEIDGRVFIAMEHVDGGTARTWLAAAPRTTGEILALFTAAGDGLAAAHAAGLIHRDFKPDNVLVGGDGRPRVADFGLARAAEGEESSAASPAAGDVTLSTQTGVVVGTPAYMPPEQLAGGELDARADQFAFAAALWEALFGARPFDGKTPADVLAAIESAPPAAAGDVPRGRRVPRHVLAALRRALSPERDDRWPDMRALLAELRRDPAATRRRTATVGLALAGGAVAAALFIPLVWRDREKPSPCKAAGDTSRVALTPAKQEAIRAALVATGAPSADDVRTVLTTLIDRQVAAIGAARIAACEATHVRRTQSAELLDRRNHCLDRREAEVAALVGVAEHLEAGKATAADGLLPAARAFGSVAECDDVERLTGLPALPADPAARAERAAIEGLVADSMTRQRAGQEEAALAAAREAMARADTAHDAALGAEARLQAAQLQATREPQAGMQLLEHASRLAAEARDDVLAARIATEMMTLAIVTLHQLDEAERLRPLAESAVVRAGDPPRQRAAYLASLARLRNEQGDHASARAAIEAAVAAEEKEWGPDDPRLANSLNYLGTVMTNQGQNEAAIAVRERAAKLLSDAYGPDHPHLAAVITNLGGSQFELGRVADAEATWRRALAIKERALGDDHPSLLPNLVNIANAELKLGRAADAMTALSRARAIAEKTYGARHPAYARVLSVIADASIAEKRFDAAEAALVDVLSVQEESGGERPEVAETLFGLADARRELGKLRLARADLERATAITERTSGAGSPQMAHALGLRAELELAEGKPAQARRTMEQAIATLELAAGPDHPDVAAMRAQLATMPAAR